MPIPPSNRIMISATVTTSSTTSMPSEPSTGNRSDIAAAPTRKIAGAGIRNRALILFDDNATATASATIRRANPNGSMSSTTPTAFLLPRCVASLEPRRAAPSRQRLEPNRFDHLTEPNPQPCTAPAVDVDLAVGPRHGRRAHACTPRTWKVQPVSVPGPGADDARGKADGRRGGADGRYRAGDREGSRSPSPGRGEHRDHRGDARLRGTPSHWGSSPSSTSSSSSSASAWTLPCGPRCRRRATGAAPVPQRQRPCVS